MAVKKEWTVLSDPGCFYFLISCVLFYYWYRWLVSSITIQYGRPGNKDAQITWRDGTEKNPSCNGRSGTAGEERGANDRIRAEFQSDRRTVSIEECVWGEETIPRGGRGIGCWRGKNGKEGPVRVTYCTKMRTGQQQWIVYTLLSKGNIYGNLFRTTNETQRGGLSGTEGDNLNLKKKTIISTKMGLPR